MRTLMLFASILMAGTGIFCLVNGSAAFLSVAFVIGALFILVGACEILIGRKADFDYTDVATSFTLDGAAMVILGVVMISGQITDDITAQMIFAMWLTIEGIKSLGANSYDVAHNTSEENVTLFVNAAMLLLGIYSFFNQSLFVIHPMLLIGAALILIGIKRFREAFDIEYIRPGFVADNQEKLQEALNEEKRALAKAKEGIREQKNAQRRIEKIKADMANERTVLNEAALRKRAAEEEEKREEAGL